VEQKCSRAAGGVEHALSQRLVQRAGDDFGGEPIGCVIFAEIVPLGRVDQALVERFEDVDLDIAQTEAGRLPGDPQDQVAAFRQFEDPVEEVALDRALNAFVVEGAAGKDRRRVAGRKIEDPRGDRLGDDGQVGVLQEQRIVADRGAIGFAQQPIPKLALQQHLGMRAQALPQLFQHASGTPEAEALAAQLAFDRQRVRGQVVAIGQRRFEPGQQRAGIGPIRRVPTDLHQGVVAQFVGDELGAVGGDADEAAGGLALALGEIVR
jgi:hypothetical protein